MSNDNDNVFLVKKEKFHISKKLFNIAKNLKHGLKSMLLKLNSYKGCVNKLKTLYVFIFNPLSAKKSTKVKVTLC